MATKIGNTKGCRAAKMWTIPKQPSLISDDSLSQEESLQDFTDNIITLVQSQNDLDHRGSCNTVEISDYKIDTCNNQAESDEHGVCIDSIQLTSTAFGELNRQFKQRPRARPCEQYPQYRKAETNFKRVGDDLQADDQEVMQSQQMQCSLSDTLNRRVRDRQRKQLLRQSPEYRQQESYKSKQRMKVKRSDPMYREMERLRDRQRRQLARAQNTVQRAAERERDREYKKRYRSMNGLKVVHEETVSCGGMVSMEQPVALTVVLPQSDLATSAISSNVSDNFT